MTVQLPEIENLEKTVASLRREFNYFLNSSTNVKKTVTISDIANGLMAVPNMIALFALNGVIVKETKDFFKRHKNGEIED